MIYNTVYQLFERIFSFCVNLNFFFINFLIKDKIAQFYFLELIAKVPYQTYLDIIKLTGRNKNNYNLHKKELENEVLHCLIAEELLGKKPLLVYYSSLVFCSGYYLLNFCMFLVFPKLAYLLMSIIEEHAYAKYIYFIDNNKDFLKNLNRQSPTTKKYITINKIENSIDSSLLQEVFLHIAQDELEHSQELRLLVFG